MKENESLTERYKRNENSSFCLYLHLWTSSVNSAMLALFSVLVNRSEGVQHEEATLISK